MGLLLLILSPGLPAATLFEDDFEADIVDTPNPVWSWKPAFVADTNKFGMMYGPSDIYNRSLAIKHSGKYSLRLNFAGRNDWCNFCLNGQTTLFMDAGTAGSVTHFIDNAGQDLLTLFPDLLDGQARVYNNSDNFTRWKVTTVSDGNATNDRLDFVDGNPGTAGVIDPYQNDMGGTGLFEAGDEITIQKQCPNGNRKVDCNLGINYLREGGGPIDPIHFPFGGTLARRMYIYLPSTTILPSITLKLGYTHFHRNGVAIFSILVLVTQRANSIEVSNEPLYGKREFTGLKLDYDKWYYLEEVFTRESTDGGSDGTYQLYMAEAGQPDALYVNRSGITYGTLSDMSIIGNWPHNNNATGSIYIDDVMIATSRIGPTGNDVVPLAAGEADIQ